jgi:integrase
VTTLRQRAEDYLELRRSLGFKMVSQGRTLASFIAHAETTGADVITSDLALDWARSAGGAANPAYWAQRLSVVRVFARHLRTLDPATQIPPLNVLRQRPRRITPRIFTGGELGALLAVAGRLQPAFRGVTWQSLLALLAVTGMRVSEACTLDRGDVDLAEGVLTIRDAKGGSRAIPVDSTTTAALARYAGERDRARPASPADAFFISTRGTRMDSSNMPRVFRSLAAGAAIQAPAGRRGPRIHDLRHSMAVTTLLRWYREGADVTAKLPLLATYMGHRDPKSTYYYLTATPELLALAAARLEPPASKESARDQPASPDAGIFH